VRQDYADVGRLAGTAVAGDPRIVEIQTRICDGERRITAIDDELVALRSQEISEAEVVAALAQFDQLWEALTPREHAQVLELLIERVTYDADSSTLSIAYRPTGIKSLANQTAQRIEDAA